jgi:hypothetical protein
MAKVASSYASIAKGGDAALGTWLSDWHLVVFLQSCGIFDSVSLPSFPLRESTNAREWWVGGHEVDFQDLNNARPTLHLTPHPLSKLADLPRHNLLRTYVPPLPLPSLSLTPFISQNRILHLVPTPAEQTRVSETGSRSHLTWTYLRNLETSIWTAEEEEEGGGYVLIVRLRTKGMGQIVISVVFLSLVRIPLLVHLVRSLQN